VQEHKSFYTAQSKYTMTVKRASSPSKSTVPIDSLLTLRAPPSSSLHLRGGSDSDSSGGGSDSGYEIEDPNDAAGYDDDDELSEEEVDYESDYSYLDSENSGDSSH
jgi:hypothetical protein